MSREMINSGIEWLGSVPKSWRLERLQWHLEEVKESNDPIKTTQVLSLTNKLGVIPYEEKGEQGNKSKENLNEYKLAYPETIVANSMNILIGSVGLSNYFGCVSPVYYVYRGKNSANIEFFNFLFQTREFQKELRKFANGILEIRLRVSSNSILKRYVPIPLKEEQEKIVKLLSDKCSNIDLLINNETSQINKLREYKKTIISETILGGLNKNIKFKSTNIEWLKNIPDTWGTPKIKYYATTCSGGTPQSSILEYYDGAINWVCSYDLSEDDILESKRKITSLGADTIAGELQSPESILIAMYGGGGTIGNSGRLKCFSRTNQAICSIHFDDHFDSSYAFYQIKFLRPYWMYYAVGTRKDPNISQDIIKNMPFLMPSLDEQKAIVKYLDEKCLQIESLIKNKQEKIEKLQEYKKSLIYEYVTGKKEV